MRSGGDPLGAATTVAPGTFAKSPLKHRMERAAVVDVIDGTFAMARNDVAHGMVVDEVA